ncbi:hypothetical protein [Shinella sp.]|jgi:hypothetical protein|uniref:hypothetical protein n=1 Tax=Shinella sp. TaxID=1870904 RepID=UPI003D28CB88
MNGPASGNLGVFCSPADVRRSLAYLMPHLDSAWDRPLGAYASQVYDVERFHTSCAARAHAMNLLRACIERAARRFGYTDEETQRAGLEFLASPVLQTGPHCLLLFEPDAFYTHLFSLMGLLARGREWHITYFVSTSGFKERAKKGPGWLPLGDEPLNLFGLPRSRMDGNSIGCLNGPYRYALANSKGLSAPNPSAARLLAELPNIEFPSAAEAVKMGNHALWQRRFPSAVKLLQLDDFDVADLIADHLEDPGSWLSSHLTGKDGVASSIVDAINRLNAGPWCGWLRWTTDFFWRLEEHRVTPLRLHDGVLESERPPRLMVRFRPDDLATALRRRSILPSLFMAFLVTSVLPGARVLGGCRQVVYYPLMRYLASVGLQQCGDVDLLTTMLNDKRPGVWGHRVLRRAESDPFHEMEAAGGISPLLARYAKSSLSQSSGDLASFTTDRLWSGLAAGIANDTVTRASNEWKWSGCGSSTLLLADR